MRKFLVLFVGIIYCLHGWSQSKLDDFGRIVLNAYLPPDMPITAEVKQALLSKLSQMVTQQGMGGSDVNPRFVITAGLTVGTKDIIPGPPQMIAQNLEITLMVGDATSNTLYASITLPLQGVGTNETKAFLEAFKRLNVKHPDIAGMIELGKKRIIEHYASQCDFIIRNAMTLSRQEKYDEAIYNLSLVPEVCSECYHNCLDTLEHIFQQRIDMDCRTKLNAAKSEWAAQQNPAGAERAADILAQIHPMASCQPQVTSLIQSIHAKLRADEQARWAFKVKQYEDKVAAEREKIRIAEEKSIRDDVFRESQAVRDHDAHENQARRDHEYREKQAVRNHDLDKLRVNAYREIGLEYARNQPKEVNYNMVLLR